MSKVSAALMNVDLIALVRQFAGECKKRDASGGSWHLCPFHGEDTPSFKVNADGTRAKCFSGACGWSGDALDFYAKINNISLAEAIRELSVGSEDRDDSVGVKEALTRASKFFAGKLNESKAAVEYVLKRGIQLSTCEEYAIGYAPDEWQAVSGGLVDPDTAFLAGLAYPRKNGNGYFDSFRNRIMFPVYSDSFGIVGFSGRSISSAESVKYLVSKASLFFKKDELFVGWNVAKRHIKDSGRVILVEGNFDVLAFAQSGFRNTLSVIGSSLSRKHADKLASIGCSVTICYDSDSAGIGGAEKAIAVCMSAGLQCSIATVRGYKDPSEAFESTGAAAIRAILDSSVSPAEWIVSRCDKGSAVSVVQQCIAAAERVSVHMQDADMRSAFMVDCRAAAKSSVCAVKDDQDAPQKRVPAVESTEQCQLSKTDLEAIIVAKRAPSSAPAIWESYSWSSLAAKEKAKVEIFGGGAVAQSSSSNVEEIEEAIDKGASMSLKLDADLYNPGGLISLGMEGLSAPGLPGYWQMNLPTVLSVIGRAGSGIVCCGKYISSFYHVKIADSQTGKSESSDAMIYHMVRAGMSDVLGPTRLQSGPAILRALVKNPNMLVFSDEIGKMIGGDKTGRDINLRGIIDVLLELYSKNGSFQVVAYSDSEKNISLPWYSFSLVGCAVPSALSDISISSLENGLMGRVNFFCYGGKLLPRGVDTGEVNHKLELFVRKIHNIVTMQKHRDGDSSRGGAFSLSTAGVANMLSDISSDILSRCNDDSIQQEEKILIAPVYGNAIRYAIVYAISGREIYDMFEPLTEDELDKGFRLALALAEWKSKTLVKRIFSSQFEQDCGVFMTACRAVYARYVAGTGGRATMSTIANRSRRASWPVARWKEIVEYLERTERIIVTREKGGKESYTPVAAY